MLCVRGRGRVPDQIKVLDFGLVKEFTAPADVGLSVDGALLGTPAYLAPESILDPRRSDGRAHLYALGAVGYYLLLGEPVFESRTLVEACVQHLHNAPVPPSQRMAGPIPAALEQLVLCCLAKAPEARPASALEPLRLLDEAADAAQWTRGDAERWWRERAPEVARAVKRGRQHGSTPGPRTIAVDLDRRAEG